MGERTGNGSTIIVQRVPHNVSQVVGILFDLITKNPVSFTVFGFRYSVVVY